MEDYMYLPVFGIAIVEPLMSSVHRLPDGRVYSSCHKQSQSDDPAAKQRNDLFAQHYAPVRKIFNI